MMLPDSVTVGTAVFVAGVMFGATLIRSALGFGEALVAVPLLALKIPVAVAAPLAVAASVVVAGVIVAQDHRKIEVRSAAGLVGWAMAGIPVGLLVLAKVDDRLVKVGLGVILMAFAAYSLRGKMRFRVEGGHRGWLAGCGFASGVLGGAYGMNGPPLVIYGAMRGWSPQQFRATLQGYFFVASLVGMAGYWALGLLGREVLGYCVVSLPGMVVAIGLGRMLNSRVKGEGFFRVVFIGLLAIGGVLLVQGLMRGG